MRLHHPALVVLALTVMDAAAANAQQSVPLPARDRALETAPALLYSLGKADGSEAEVFSGIFGVGFDRNDHLYVLDSQSHRVVVFDGAGSFVRQFGKRGGGPGEMQFPMGLAVTSDGFIVIADLGKQAYLRYRSDGTFESSIPFEPGQGVSPQLLMRSHPREGLIVQRQLPPDMEALEKSAAAGQTITLNPATQIHTEPLAAGASSTVLFVQQPKSQTQPIDAGMGDMSFRMALPIQVHFSPGLHWDVMPDGGVAVAHEASYVVRIISASGAVTRVLTRAIAPRAVTRADRDRILEAQRERRLPASTQLPPEARAMAEGLLKQMEANAQFAEVHPVIRDVRTDSNGRIWISRNGADEKTRLIDIVGADGRYAGTVRGLAMPIAFSASGRIAHIEYDDDGVESVVVRQMPEDWR